METNTQGGDTLMNMCRVGCILMWTTLWDSPHLKQVFERGTIDIGAHYRPPHVHKGDREGRPALAEGMGGPSIPTPQWRPHVAHARGLPSSDQVRA